MTWKYGFPLCSHSRLIVEIVGLAVDLMLAQSFPGFKCLTAALAFKRPYAGWRGVRKFFFHLCSSRNNYFISQRRSEASSRASNRRAIGATIAKTFHRAAIAHSMARNDGNAVSNFLPHMLPFPSE
jgi:hypothetical protein